MTTSTEQAEEQVTGPPEPDHHRPPRARRRFLMVGTTVLVVAVAAGGAVSFADKIDVKDPFGRDREVAPPPATEGTALASVRKGPLASQVNQSGTLAYAARPDGTPYSLINQTGGIYTWLPGAGRVVKCGQVLYWVGDTPVALLCGPRPFYRDLSYGDEGWDVKQLNKNLLALGYATTDEIDADEDDFTSETTEALENFQDAIGADETGTLKLGSAIFMNGPLRVTSVLGKLGTRAMPGTPVLEAATTRRQVTVELNASQQSEVKVGMRALITLPNNRTTPGVVSRIGTVATSSSDDDSGPKADSGSTGATIPVYITLQRPKDAGTLDQAPVQVQITTAGVKQALFVPVTALVGKAGGGYAVETVDVDGVHRTVPVTLGLFDNANGLVQVSGKLAVGNRVVVPAT
jgi:hypothetical protein